MQKVKLARRLYHLYGVRLLRPVQRLQKEESTAKASGVSIDAERRYIDSRITDMREQRLAFEKARECDGRDALVAAS